jgi:hypothetical protein
MGEAFSSYPRRTSCCCDDVVEFPSFGEGDDVGPDVRASAFLISCPSSVEFPAAEDAVGDDVGTMAVLVSLRRVVVLDIIMR